MRYRYEVRCGNCDGLIGYCYNTEPLPSIYCEGCSDYREDCVADSDATRENG